MDRGLFIHSQLDDIWVIASCWLILTKLLWTLVMCVCIWWTYVFIYLGYIPRKRKAIYYERNILTFGEKKNPNCSPKLLYHFYIEHVSQCSLETQVPSCVKEHLCFVTCSLAISIHKYVLFHYYHSLWLLIRWKCCSWLTLMLYFSIVNLSISI